MTAENNNKFSDGTIMVEPRSSALAAKLGLPEEIDFDW
jgi:hypothetical protein